jgi:hypothetical protein
VTNEGREIVLFQEFDDLFTVFFTVKFGDVHVSFSLV